MVKVNVNGKEFYMDGYTKEILDKMKTVIKKDWDMFIIIDGIEGAGKSVLAQQIGAYLGDGLVLDDVTFSPKEFKRRILEQDKYKCVIFDESFRGLSSRRAMSQTNFMLMRLFNEMRKRNLFVILVIPSFMELDKYAAVWRSRLLFHVYTDENGERGRYTIYDQNKKKNLYFLGKKMGYNYNVVKAGRYCRFLNGYMVDQIEYNKKKDLAMTEDDSEKTEEEKLDKYEKMYRHRFWLVTNYLANTKQLKKFCDEFDLDKHLISTLRWNYAEKLRKSGHNPAKWGYNSQAQSPTIR